MAAWRPKNVGTDKKSGLEALGDLSQSALKGSLKMPRRKSLPVKVSRPQKDRSKLKGGIPLDELLTGTPRIGGELRLRGSNGTACPSRRSSATT
jgi:hypothetical protein